MENTSLESYSEYIDKDILDSFKNFLASNDIETLNSEATKIASTFASEKELKALLSSDINEKNVAETKLVNSFHNNLKLLVQKTWVDKGDESITKDSLLNRLDNLCNKIELKKYNETYSETLSVLNESVALMFGASDTSEEDFGEYALRIDPVFGTFWCFLQCFPKQSEWNTEKLRLSIILGMCFFANY